MDGTSAAWSELKRKVVDAGCFRRAIHSELRNVALVLLGIGADNARVRATSEHRDSPDFSAVG